MRSRYLDALEHDRWDDLPGRTYARAFLRTYASALNLDADRFVAEFDAQNPEPEELDQPAAPPPRHRTRLLPFALAPAAGLVAIVVVLVWSAWGQGNHTPLPSPPSPSAASAAARPASRHVSHVRAAHKTIRANPALVVTAVGGRCWLQARRGGPTGSVIAERTLEQGQRLRLTGRHIWLRLGAPWNVQVRRGTQPVKIAPTTLPLNLTA
jgi:cytoskeleton protein RodZ